MNLSKFSPMIKNMIEESSRKCFDNLPILPYRTGNKLLKQKPIGPIAIQYHLKDLTKNFKKLDPEFQTDLQERRTEALHKLRTRGKGPPKKGQGKRAMQKK
jgi:small subunit ribosomal protein S33